MKKINLAVIGLGRAGSIHFKNIHQSLKCTIKYALDSRQSQLDNFRELYGDDGITYLLISEIGSMLSDTGLDGVVICTPTDTHEHLIFQALTKGKSVFCEKPISTSNDGIIKCYDLASATNLTLHCSLNRRYDPALLTIWKTLQTKQMGRIHIIKTCARDNPKPSIDYLKISNGIFHDCAIHDIDLMLWMLEQKPKSIYVCSFTEDPNIAAINDVETALISLTFEDGTLGVIDLSRQSGYGYDQRVEVHCTKGMLQSLNQRMDNCAISNSNGLMETPIKFSFDTRYAESYVNSLNEFLDCVINKRPSPISKDTILTLTKIADLCEQSKHLKQVVNCDL